MEWGVHFPFLPISAFFFFFLMEATGIEVLIGLGTWVPLFGDSSVLWDPGIGLCLFRPGAVSIGPGPTWCCCLLLPGLLLATGGLWGLSHHQSDHLPVVWFSSPLS